MVLPRNGILPGPQSKRDERYAAKAATEAALAKTEPPAAGSAGKALVHGPSGPVWADHEFNVKAYGAVGDFVADDTAAIQAAIDAAAAVGGGTVYIPASSTDYLITGVTLAAGVVLQGAGRRRSRLRCTSLTASGITIHGASVGVKAAQVGVRDLALIGPGRASGGTGYGVDIKWSSFGCEYRNVWVYGWGSHGVRVEDSYMAVWDNCQFQENGGDGFYGLKNINNTIWLRCQSSTNSGRGIAIDGGAASTLIGYDAEGNTGAGIDLRYCHGYQVATPELEQNGQDGTSPNLYIGGRSGAEPSTGVEVVGGINQGQSITATGVVLENCNQCGIGGRMYFQNMVTRDIEVKSTAARCEIGRTAPATGTLNVLNSSASLIRVEYDYANLMAKMSPGLRLAPGSTPPVLAEGMIWADDAGNVLKTRDDANTRRLITVLEGSTSVAPTNLAAGGTTDITITVTGAVAGDGALVIVPLAINAGIHVTTCWVSAANTVKVRLYNSTALATDTTSATAGWKAKVYKG